MSWLEYFSLFIFVWLPGVLMLKYWKIQKSSLTLFLTFSGAYILGISAFHILPDVYKDGDEGYGLYLIIGFLSQIVLDQFSRGLEHGHIHPAHDSKFGFLLSIMFGLGIHAFFFFFSLSGYSNFHAGHDHNHSSLLLGIILHHAPAAIAMGLLIKMSGYSSMFSVMMITLFAILPPLGAFIGNYLIISQESYRIIMAIVVGAFMHVSTTIIFESEPNAEHKISYKKLIAIVLGLLVSYFLTMH